ncbi:MAG: hypothetical protein AAGD25_28915 [Cyanobacteria bacterium P01_F01_bin.150]
MSRDLFAKAAIAQIPKILTLLDRNPHSPTYGCFDRNFWHYKIIDFPSGMSQEFVWPLALVYALPLPDNPYYQQASIKAWVDAGILYAARSAHADGSCDDYFPFERAGGAAAFSLLACIESYTLLGLHNPDVLDFFEQRADWLAHHQESGRLTNHQALIVLCLELIGRLMETTKWNKAKQQRLRQVLSWQDSEGWFQEYEGCDPGYHTLTISCLARYYEIVCAKPPLNPSFAGGNFGAISSPSEQTSQRQGEDHNGVEPDLLKQLKDAIAKATQLASHFVHPDGSYGGEYTSRNTYNFFPHGFELVGKWLPEALNINDRFLRGLAHQKEACYADDHIIGHHTWNYLLTWQDFVNARPPLKPKSDQRFWLPNARLLVDRRGDTELFLALNKGGVLKAFKGDRLLLSDTQFSLQVKSGTGVKNAVGHLVGPYDIQVEPDRILIQGALGWAKQKQMTPLNLMILRGVMFTVGRFFPNLIRSLLQKVLITGKKPTPFRFSRELRWHNESKDGSNDRWQDSQTDGYWQVTDELHAESWRNVVSVGMGCDQTSIYVVMSRTFQASQLQPWLDLTKEVRQLPDGVPLKVERSLR